MPPRRDKTESHGGHRQEVKTVPIRTLRHPVRRRFDPQTASGCPPLVNCFTARLVKREGGQPEEALRFFARRRMVHPGGDEREAPYSLVSVFPTKCTIHRACRFARHLRQRSDPASLIMRKPLRHNQSGMLHSSKRSRQLKSSGSLSELSATNKPPRNGFWTCAHSCSPRFSLSLHLFDATLGYAAAVFLPRSTRCLVADIS